DINECVEPRQLDCGHSADCANVPGSYYCHCSDGYEPSSGKANFTPSSENICQDIDECQGRAADCGPHANCTNAWELLLQLQPWLRASSGKANFTHASENTCQVPSINSSTDLEGIKETCRNFSLQVRLNPSFICWVFCPVFFTTSMEIPRQKPLLLVLR
ncbi:adhesion G protein-coupled receptor E5, partial [Chelydra serpentina]